MSGGVDATQFGTTIVKVRSRAELDMIVERMEDGEGLMLVKDLTFDYEFLEEGRSLSLVEKAGVNTKAEMFEQIAKECEEKADGKFVPPVQFSFFRKLDVMKSVAAIAANLEENQKKRDEKDFVKEAYKEAGIGENEKFKYNFHLREWDVPDLTGKDARQGDERFVSGGPPRALGEAPDLIATSRGSPTIKKISNYTVGEPNAEKRNQKIYIEEPDVVNCEQSRIRVDFDQTAWSVKADTETATYTLGPIDCGHIVPRNCSWRLSPGKRLTLTLVGSQPQEHPAMAAKAAEMNAVNNAPGEWQMFGAVVAVVFAFLALVILTSK